jgi:large subunit ribosomal protein L31e
MVKKTDKAKIVLERVYNVPLRREFLKSPKWKRTKKAVRVLREFLMKHMKSSDVKIGKYLNLELWKCGIKNPPHHVKVNVTKDDKGTVRAELFGYPKEEPKEKKEKKAEEKKENNQ